MYKDIITNCIISFLNNFAYEIIVFIACQILLGLNFFQNGYNKYLHSLEKWTEEKTKCLQFPLWFEDDAFRQAIQETEKEKK